MQNLSCLRTHERIYCRELEVLRFFAYSNLERTAGVGEGVLPDLRENRGRRLQEEENPGNLASGQDTYT